jgi:hypothetical protein
MKVPLFFATMGTSQPMTASHAWKLEFELFLYLSVMQKINHFVLHSKPNLLVIHPVPKHISVLTKIW